jgi:hypothetical protein
MINGSGGYEFPGEGYSFATSPHATLVTDACVGCHMGSAETHVGYTIGGHSFAMVDEESGENLAALCATGACHDNEAEEYDFLADEDYDMDGSVEGYQTEVDGLLDSLGELLYAQGVVTDEYEPQTDTIADANVAGAIYNMVYVKEDQSRGIHNFRYTRDLLLNSIDYVSSLPTLVVPQKNEITPMEVALLKSH